MNTDRLKHLAAAARSVIILGVVFELINWGEIQIAAVIGVVETVGALIYANNRQGKVEVEVVTPEVVTPEVVTPHIKTETTYGHPEVGGVTNGPLDGQAT